MPRKPARPNLGREVAPVASQSVCDNLCFDMECQQCWGFLGDVLASDLWHLRAGPAVKPLRVTVNLDEETYVAIQAEAVSHGATVAEVVRVVMRDWADRRGKAR